MGSQVGDALDVEFDGVRFVSGFVEREGSDDSFTLVKSPDLVTRYDRLLAGFDASRIVELGIKYGGSTAFFAVRARPHKLVAIEFESTRVAHLDRFIETRGLAAAIRPYFGVDQGDRDKVRAILAEEFGSEPLDLVVDDASHRYGPTLASFETIFPLLRPNGLYIIEDWTGLHEFAAALERRLADDDTAMSDAAASSINNHLQQRGAAETPLSRLVVEFTLAEAAGSGIVDELCVNPHWIAVRRGTAQLEPGKFRLIDHYIDPFGMVRP
jgi:predicted O-methyltransferase YrrM